MSSTAIPFPRPQGYCKRKQCCCEYANVFGYCVNTICVKSTAEKTEYLTNTILSGGDANDSKQSCTISDDVGSGGRESERSKSMTKWEQMELDNMQAVRQFLSEHNINACDLARYAKKLCACGTCHFFTQHYAKSGEALDWGHCWKGNIQHSKKVSTSACGFWEYGEEQEHE